MKELEKLLNSLVQRGRKPWGVKTNFYWIEQGKSLTLDPPYYSRTFRELVSLESGLWAFICENNLYKSDDNMLHWIKHQWSRLTTTARKSYPEYRLLESALIPEKELAKFLIDNIKVAWIMN